MCWQSYKDLYHIRWHAKIYKKLLNTENMGI